ncbi:hypothetical protein GCM10010989_03950 [Croceicoccus pelagius]|uniref:Uncharacterized protein n=3 Tax=Croceicoccus pelagius TaxID=1703341 RepID=A0A916Y6F8_9SPHN|nr:hypothetical protein GCM10010989_03950 [Croceicoccus pelagius]
MESREGYEVRFIDADGVAIVWEVPEAHLDIDAATATGLRAKPRPATFEIRQIGDHARSLPLSLNF